MTTNQAPKGTVLTDEQIYKIYADTFDSADGVARPAPKTLPPLVYAFARALLSAQPASAPLQDEDAKRYQAIRKMLTSTEEENERFVDLMTEVIGDEIGRPTPEQFDKAIDHAIAAQGAKQI